MPYSTLQKGYENVGSGGTVYLKAGTCYQLPGWANKNYNYWTTITAAPGLAREQVKIKKLHELLNLNMTLFKNVTLYSDYSIATYGEWNPFFVTSNNVLRNI